MEKGTDRGIKIHGPFFFLFSLLKINSVYYEWVEQWTTVVPGGQRDREEEEEEEKSKGGRGKDVEGETLLR